MEERQETFSYNYSASQQAEIRNIRDKYIKKEESKMEQLRRLDASVTKPGMIAALSVGIISILVMGFGMCCSMVWMDSLFIPGIIIGIAGMAGLGASYPLYLHITKKQREKLAPEIIRLTDELMK